jgi:hypothetical protein
MLDSAFNLRVINNLLHVCINWRQKIQSCGSGSGHIGIIFPDPDPHPELTDPDPDPFHPNVKLK